jgi:hypothetical protein
MAGRDTKSDEEKRAMKRICLTSALIIVAGRLLLAQEIPWVPARDTRPAAEEKSKDSYVIFSNLGARDDLYNSDAYEAEPIEGKDNGDGEPEQWDAVLFVPQVDVQAQVLEAAIGYSSGTRLISLGLYSNEPTAYTPDTVLPGGEVETMQIPALGDCCQLTKVTLPGKGVILSAGTPYWLVAKTDDAKGPDFSGGWQVSHLGESAYLESPYPWNPQPGEWPAARVSGARLETQKSRPGGSPATSTPGTNVSSGQVTIYSNLNNSAFSDPYLPNTGLLICGSDSSYGFDGWEALPFTAQVTGHAKTLTAAIALSSGTRKIILDLYSDSGGLPGTLLHDGEGSTEGFPDVGQCCEFAVVTLPGKGVALTKGVQYWLVARADEVNAPDFVGTWQISSNNIWSNTAFGGWTDYDGDWVAAKITGTSQ